MKGKYLYGIIKTRGHVRRGGGIATVDFRRLSAVVAEAEVKDYLSLSKEETIRKLIVHQQQIEKIMEEVAYVLPVKFGTILRDEEEVRSVLEKAYSFLLDTLDKIEGKIELDLVCFWNEKKAAKLAYQESKRVRDFYKKIASKASSTSEVKSLDASEVSPAGEVLAAESKIALGKLVSKYLATKRGKISSQILKVLKKEAVESCSHTLAEINMIINQAFLVEKENEEVFNHALNQLDSRFKELVNFRLVGPLPPYSFATVVIDALDKEEVEKAKKLLNPGGEVNEDSVKRAYDKLAFKLHPDKAGDPMAFEFATRGYKLLRKYADHGLVGVYLYKWEDQ